MRSGSILWKLIIGTKKVRHNDAFRLCPVKMDYYPPLVDHVLQHEADPGRGFLVLDYLLHLIEVLVHTRLQEEAHRQVSPRPHTHTHTHRRTHLGLLEVQVLADGGQQPAEALQGLGVVVLEQLHDAVVHDDLRQHLELEQLADELDVAERPPPGDVLRLLELHGKPLLLLRLPEEQEGGGV